MAEIFTKYTNGWTKCTYDDKGTINWISPDAQDKIGNYQYTKRLREGLIPSGKSIGSEIPEGFPDENALNNAVNHSNYPSQSRPNAEPKSDVTEINMPDPKSNSQRPAAGRATPAAIARGLQTALMIGTSLVSAATNLPDVAMKEVEAKGIAIPCGNMIAQNEEMNRKFGILIANSGDAQLALYAGGQYSFRVSQAIKQRVQERKAQRNGNRGHAPNDVSSQGYGEAGAGNPTPIFYRPTLSGNRAFTGTAQ